MNKQSSMLIILIISKKVTDFSIFLNVNFQLLLLLLLVVSFCQKSLLLIFYLTSSLFAYKQNPL